MAAHPVFCGQSPAAAPNETPAPAQATTPAQQAPVPPSSGTVLFERHAPPVQDTPLGEADGPEPSTPTPLPSRRGEKRSGLQKHGDRRPSLSDAPPAESSGATPHPAGLPEAARTTADEGDSSLSERQPLRPTEADARAAAAVSSSDRAALHILSSDLDLHLDSHTGEASVRARLLLRNDSTSALVRLPLQISSALQWQSARLQPAGSASRPLPLEQHLLPTDLDHTGAATEATLLLPEPLVPGASASLDLFYSGTLTASAERLLRLGAPDGQAKRTDWDTVTDDFVGLRGAGEVLWYPVAAAPVFLGEGVAFTQKIDAERAANAETRMRLRLTLAYADSPPDAAFFAGERQPLLPIGVADTSPSTSSSTSNADPADPEPDRSGGIVVADWPMQLLGFRTPSIFVATSAPQQTGEPELRPITDKADAAAAYAAAAAAVRPLLSEWLGASPSGALTVLDLPEPGGAPFSDGRLLVAPMHAAEVTSLAPSLAYSLTSAWLPAASTDPWLHDGLAEFMRMLYLERTAGRDASLASLAADGDLLARREAFATGEGAPLQHCGDAICARTKAAYVFEMLRTLAGENALKQAISGWRVAAERDPDKATTATLEALLTKASGKDLRWFYTDWIEGDHGLPELTIVTVAPRRVERAGTAAPVTAKRQIVGGPIGAEPVPQPGDPDSRSPAPTAPVNGIAPAEGSWLVAVEVANNGNAAAEVPVSVRSGSLINTVTLRVPGHGRATVRVPFEAEPQEVVVNDGFVPEMRTNTHRKRLDGIQ